MKKPKYTIGDKYPTWFSDMPDGMSHIMAVLPYTGRFTEYFRFVLRLSAPRTRSGYLEIAVE